MDAPGGADGGPAAGGPAAAAPAALAAGGERSGPVERVAWEGGVTYLWDPQSLTAAREARGGASSGGTGGSDGGGAGGSDGGGVGSGGAGGLGAEAEGEGPSGVAGMDMVCQGELARRGRALLTGSSMRAGASRAGGSCICPRAQPTPSPRAPRPRVQCRAACLTWQKRWR
jgi:hypothetical protein